MLCASDDTRRKMCNGVNEYRYRVITACTIRDVF